MAIGLSQTVQGNGGGYVQSFTKSITPSSGNLVTVCWSAGPQSTDTLSIADNNTNTWHLAVQQNLAGARQTKIYYVYNCHSGATTITFSNTAFGDSAVIIQEWSGVLSSSDPLDITASGTTTSGTTYTVTTGTTNFANELLLGSLGCDKNTPSFTGDAGWTNLLSQAGFDAFTSTTTQYRLPTSKAAYTWTLTNGSSQQASQAIACFKSATQPTATNSNFFQFMQ